MHKYNSTINNVFSVQLRLACREFISNFWIAFFNYFPLVISVFFCCCFRITRRFMLRRRNELNRCPGPAPRSPLLCTPLLQWLRTQGGLAKFASLLIRLRNVLSDFVKKMQNFQRISSRKLCTEFLSVNILAACLMFITRFCSDEERTWVGLLDWTYSECHRESEDSLFLQLLEAFLIRW